LDIATTATFAMKKCVKQGNKVWRIIAKSLGEKSGKNNQEADIIALVRLLMFLSILITNCFIVAGVIRHWNDVEYPINNQNVQKFQ
jgi:hypothetical protein